MVVFYSFVSIGYLVNTKTNMEEKDYQKKVDRHDQILTELVEGNKQNAQINSKLNGYYTALDKKVAIRDGEVANDLRSIKNDVSDMKDTLSMVVEGYVRREEFEARFKRLQEELDSRILGLHDRISKTEDNIKWVVRIVIGAVILALMGLIIVTK